MNFNSGVSPDVHGFYSRRNVFHLGGLIGFAVPTEPLSPDASDCHGQDFFV